MTSPIVFFPKRCLTPEGAIVIMRIQYPTTYLEGEMAGLKISAGSVYA